MNESRILLRAFAPALLLVGCTTINEVDTTEERWLFDPTNPDTAIIEDDVVGVELAYPTKWRVVRDPYLFDTHGFVLAEETSADEHGIVPIARIALDYGAHASDLDQRVMALRDEFPDIALETWTVDVGGYEGIAIGPMPGAQPGVAILAAADEGLYRIHYYGESLEGRGNALLSSLRFTPPEREVTALELIRADSPQALFGADGPRPNIPRGEEADAEIDTFAGWAEYRLTNGCWAQPSGLFLQTTHSRDANGTGWSQMGTPNFWGERTHGNWGMGRCSSGYYTNDLYAIDYYLRRGDRLYSPINGGYVMYAGWDPYGWWNYGKMVVIATPGGKYWSLSAHLSHVNVVPGQYVTRNTLIGWAGSTGYAAPYPHVHQAYYRWARHSYGRPFGGQGLKPTRLRFLGNGGGAYTNFFKGKWASW